MESFSFALKTILFTVLMIWVCQIKFDERTVEKHFIDFVRNSPVTEPIHRIGDGSRKLANDGWRQVQILVGAVDTKTKTNEPSLKKESSFKWTWGSSQSRTNGNADRENDNTEE